MERRFNELWPKSVPTRPEDLPAMVYVAVYTAVVDVDIVRAELRFNEALHPDEILRVLRIHEWGFGLGSEPSVSLNPWPPEGCTERDRFPMLLAARDASEGPYRSCTLESRLSEDGFALHDYRFGAEVPAPPGLTDDDAAMIFVHSLAQSDVRGRIAALRSEG